MAYHMRTILQINALELRILDFLELHALQFLLRFPVLKVPETPSRINSSIVRASSLDSQSGSMDRTWTICTAFLVGLFLNRIDESTLMRILMNKISLSAITL